MRNVFIAAVVLALAGSFGCATTKSKKKDGAKATATTKKSTKKKTAKKTAKKPVPKYPENVAKVFMDACTADAPEAQCKCQLRKLERSVPAEELSALEPAKRAEIVADCAGL